MTNQTTAGDAEVADKRAWKGYLSKRHGRRKTQAYSTSLKIRIAFMAGEGKTAREICDELGISDPHKLRTMLRSIGLRPRSSRSIVVPADTDLLEALGAAADRADLAPEEFAGQVLSVMVMEEPAILKNLLEG